MSINVLDFDEVRPQVSKVPNDPEPPLRIILYRYYYSFGMPIDEAIECANKYVDAFVKQSNVEKKV